MPVNINASNSAGIQITADTSGVIQFQSNGANTASIQANGVVTSAGLTSTGLVTAANVTLSSGGILTFADATTQNTAAVSGGMTLLGTITTTSGSSQSLTGLNLTTYKQVVMVFQGVSGSSTGIGFLLGTSTADDVLITGTGVAQADTIRGFAWIDLTNGTYMGVLANAGTSATGDAAATAILGARGGDLTITTASTSISVAPEAGNFDAGSILVYGVK